MEQLLTTGQGMLPIDVTETPDTLKLKTALPGVEPKDVHIEVNDNVLTVSAERRYKDEGGEGGYRCAGSSSNMAPSLTR